MKRRLNLVCLLLSTLIASNVGAFSRITSTTGVEPNGNLLNDSLRTMDYTAWNLPKLITKTTGTNAGSTLAYDYDASHARIKEVSTLHGTTYYAGGYELVIPASSTANQNQIEERSNSCKCRTITANSSRCRQVQSELGDEYLLSFHNQQSADGLIHHRKKSQSEFMKNQPMNINLREATC